MYGKIEVKAIGSHILQSAVIRQQGTLVSNQEQLVLIYIPRINNGRNGNAGVATGPGFDRFNIFLPQAMIK
jgi:hypothetical protein